MKTYLSLLATFALALVLLSLTGALASSAASPAKRKLVPIVMRDPGCHWFKVGAKYTVRLTVHGATSFRNEDEAALVFKSAGAVVKLPVGKTLTVAKPGRYHITMVGQAPDDNHLLLVVS